MSFKTTAVMLGMLLAILWVFGLVLAWNKTKIDPGAVVPGLAKQSNETINAITIYRDGKQYSFSRDEAGKWTLGLTEGAEPVRADADKINSLINQIREARKVEVPELDRNLSRWGLSTPEAKITLKSTTGKEWTLNVGKTDASKKIRFFNSLPGQDRQVFAVPVAKMEQVVAENINDFREFKLLDVTDTNTSAITITDMKDKKTLELVRDSDGGWQIKKPPYGPADFAGATPVKGPAGVRGLLLSIGAIRVQSDKDFLPLTTTLDGAKALYRIDVERAADALRPGQGIIKEALLIGPKTGEKDHETYQVRMADEKAVESIAAKTIDNVLEFFSNPTSIRSKDLAQIAPSKVDAIEVAQGKELKDVTFLYRQRPVGWEVSSGPLRHKANADMIQGPDGLIATLEGKDQIKEFFDPKDDAEAKSFDAKAGFDSSSFKVSLYVNSLEETKKDTDKKGDKPGKDKKADDKKGEKDKAEQKQDKKAEVDQPKLKADAKPAIILIFGNVAGDHVYVKRILADGLVSRVSVPVALQEKARPTQGAIAFYDNQPTPFDTDDVAKLELTRPDGVKFIVEREEAKAPDKEKAKSILPEPAKWKLVEPKDPPSRTTVDGKDVERVLDTLESLTAKKWVKQVGPKDSLKEFDLAAPSLVATLTFKKKETAKEKEGAKEEPKTLVYQFGGKTTFDKEKAGVYAMLTGGDVSNLVFVAAADQLKPLEDAEFRERTVLKFDAAKVKEMKVSVITKAETARPVFTLKDKAWIVKSGLPADFKLNEANVAGLVRTLSELKAEKYVVGKGGPAKTHDLGDKAPLKIEVVMDDGKTTHTLTIGAASGKSYFAQSSELPGAVFLLPDAAWQPVLAGKAFFGALPPREPDKKEKESKK